MCQHDSWAAPLSAARPKNAHNMPTLFFLPASKTGLSHLVNGITLDCLGSALGWLGDVSGSTHKQIILLARGDIELHDWEKHHTALAFMPKKPPTPLLTRPRNCLVAIRARTAHFHIECSFRERSVTSSASSLLVQTESVSSKQTHQKRCVWYSCKLTHLSGIILHSTTEYKLVKQINAGLNGTHSFPEILPWKSLQGPMKFDRTSFFMQVMT